MKAVLALDLVGTSLGITGIGLGVMLLVSSLYLQAFPVQPFTYAPYLADPFFFWWLSEVAFKASLSVGLLGVLLRYIEYRYRSVSV